MSLLSKLVINILTKAQLSSVTDVSCEKKDLYFGGDDEVYLIPHEQEAPNIEIGTVESGDVSSVTVSKTDDKAVLNFVIQKGTDGNDGKSAFAAAQEGGYTGTEAEFNASLSSMPSYCPFVVGTSSPADTKLLWIDSGNDNVMKFYNGTEWTPLGAVYT